jgi:hypothetical protein
MAYTRFTGKKYRRGGWVGNIPPSETYIFGSFYSLECCGCRLSSDRFFATNSRREMLKHIRRHRKAGHAVPRAAWRRLVREIRRDGDEY